MYMQRTNNAKGTSYHKVSSGKIMCGKRVPNLAATHQQETACLQCSCCVVARRGAAYAVMHARTLLRPVLA
eukprot:2858203-Pleurochrysis_carterae.AAC.1